MNIFLKADPYQDNMIPYHGKSNSRLTGYSLKNRNAELAPVFLSGASFYTWRILELRSYVSAVLAALAMILLHSSISGHDLANGLIK